MMAHKDNMQTGNRAHKQRLKALKLKLLVTDKIPKFSKEEKVHSPEF